MSRESNRFQLGVIIVAVVVLAAVTAVVWRLYRGDNALLRDVAFSAEQITPNADGFTDATRITYDLTRSANVSIYFEDKSGTRFYFRDGRMRGADEYEVLFSGVVDGFTLPDETIQGEILARLLPNGTYQWVVEATDLSGYTEQATGQLIVAEVDEELPDLRDYSLDRSLFTPNQDGIDDRVLIQYWLAKEATVRVFLEMPDGSELPIPETERDVPAGAAGRHYYDYEGGVDDKETPPPDGRYQVVALAEDAEGQKVRAVETLEIALGGVPRADIFAPPAGDTFAVNTTAVTICNTMYFTATVENYGETPIRTTGPFPGTVYDSDWNYNSLGWFTESGAWRFAVGYENEISNYPYRWAIGNPDELTEIDGHLYLMPGQRALITGGIRVVAPFGERNPQPVWAGLIHEDVEISEFNNRVDPKQVLVDMPNPADVRPCEARELPEKVEVDTQ